MTLVPSTVTPVTYPQWLAGQSTIPWPDAWARLAASRNYWVASLRRDGSPHTRPVWGVCTEDTFLLSTGGGYWMNRNIRTRPDVSVHPEPAEGLVVVVEGVAVLLSDKDRRGRAVSAYNEKYGEEYADAEGWFEVRPRRVFAWQTGGESFHGTRYEFADGRSTQRN